VNNFPNKSAIIFGLIFVSIMETVMKCKEELIVFNYFILIRKNYYSNNKCIVYPKFL